ncbi:hypothetical protein BLNAU_14943 [Blattamonas nauphoetae]|uniref:Uncharacterized protein n=1 Tax=Blattamonas nauphoetae TaxID=2049346 RepID=A0ABQ9XIN9_9EUKA|nr:hypothetical protein BLNAU_14943 [Blattamonas nauphoetae]
MAKINKKIDTSSSQARTDLSFPQQPLLMDSSAFLNWNEEELESESENAVVFHSLVATVKLQHELDASLEAKTVEFLSVVTRKSSEFADDFLDNLASRSDDSSANFIQCIVVLISSASKRIITATMKMFDSLIIHCSIANRLALVTAGLIPQIINTLNPQSLSFAETVDIQINIENIIWFSLGLSTPEDLAQLEIEDDDEQPTVHETVFQQVLIPSEKCICHLCVHRFSIIDSYQSRCFLILIARLLEISPSYQPTMDYVLCLPVFLTIPICLTFFEKDYSIWILLKNMVDAQREWNKKGGVVQQKCKKIDRMLRKEGIEDVMEKKLRNDHHDFYGEWIAKYSIDLNNLLGMNLPESE